MGEDSTDNLQEREDELAERYAAEDGGTGLSYYDDDNYGYNYQDSNPLTDIDYQQPNDESSAFTGGYTGEDDYDPVNREDDEESDDEDFDGDDEDFDGDGGNFDGNDEEDEDNDNVENEDEDSDVDDDNGNDDYGEGGGKNKREKKDRSKKEKDDGEDLSKSKKVKKEKITHEEAERRREKKFAKLLGVKFIWHEGEEITVETLQQYWSVFHKHVPDLKEYMDQADKIVEESLNSLSCGPNLMINANRFLTAMGDSTNAGMIQSLLNMIARPGITLVFGAWAAVEALFDQQWTQVALIFGLKAGLRSVLKIGFVQGVMDYIFTKGMEKLKNKFKYENL